MATSRPNWVSLRLSAFLIGMPITANIIQTMKHTVNAIVLMATTDHCFVFCDATIFPFTKLKNLLNLCLHLLRLQVRLDLVFSDVRSLGSERSNHHPSLVCPWEIIRRGGARPNELAMLPMTSTFELVI